MILWLHKLRSDEEGQTLVLGAVFGIVLALCVLGTVNLGRAVYEKMQVQTACDNGAYSQAAVEARVLNLTAYTNRAMVVHYASIMAASAYLTWLHFTDVFVHGLFQVASWIPYIGEVFTIINQVITVIMYAIDIAVAAMTPIISAANIVLYLLQEGAWLSTYSVRLQSIPPEAHSGDNTSNDAYRPMWPNLIPTANATVFAQTRGNLTVTQSFLQTAQIFINSSNASVQEARLHMLEIANSARQPWVAYGDRYSNPSDSPFGRHWSTPKGPCNAQFGTNARTQLGSSAPGFLTSLLNTAGGFFGEIYSGSRMQVSVNCSVFTVPISAVVGLFSLTTLDELLPTASQSTYSGVHNKGGIVGTVIKGVLSFLGLTNAFNLLVPYGQQQVPVHADYRATWISPYVYFAPSTKAGPAGGVSALNTGLGNFGQPDVIFGLARQRADFNRNPLFAGKVNSIVGGAAANGSVDFSYNGNDWPVVPGLPGPLQLHEGFNALCAAQTYYHRPGDWKEMPNFFNPLWAARLMPVNESNAASFLKVSSVPLVQQALLH